MRSRSRWRRYGLYGLYGLYELYRSYGSYRPYGSYRLRVVRVPPRDISNGPLSHGTACFRSRRSRAPSPRTSARQRVAVYRMIPAGLPRGRAGSRARPGRPRVRVLTPGAPHEQPHIRQSTSRASCRGSDQGHGCSAAPRRPDGPHLSRGRRRSARSWPRLAGHQTRRRVRSPRPLAASRQPRAGHDHAVTRCLSDTCTACSGAYLST